MYSFNSIHYIVDLTKSLFMFSCRLNRNISVKLRMKMENVSNWQQPDQKAENSKRPPIIEASGLQPSKKNPNLEAGISWLLKKCVLVQWKMDVSLITSWLVSQSFLILLWLFNMIMTCVKHGLCSRVTYHFISSHASLTCVKHRLTFSLCSRVAYHFITSCASLTCVKNRLTFTLSSRVAYHFISSCASLTCVKHRLTFTLSSRVAYHFISRFAWITLLCHSSITFIISFRARFTCIVSSIIEIATITIYCKFLKYIDYINARVPCVPCCAERNYF